MSKRAVLSCFDTLIEKTPDVIIVEDFNNVAVPCTGSEFFNRISAVLAINPGCLLFSDGKKYLETLETLSSYGKLLGTITMENIMEFLKLLRFSPR